MARLPRNEVEAGVHHVFARGVEKRLIFLDDDDRRLYLRILVGVVERFGWRCLAYCLMPNHVHLLIETREPNLGRGMHLLHGLYAQSFNTRWTRVGHLFQGRFGSRLVHDEVQMATVAAYIAVNPVAAGLCAQPREWPWGSHAAMVRGNTSSHPLLDLDRLRAHLAPLGEGARVYAGFVQARLSGELPAPS
jgi:REP element-mobilizing transposase RayT